MTEFTIEHAKASRRQFPALFRIENDREVVFFDGPAGTQVPMAVVDAMGEYLLGCNANQGGVFQTSLQSDRWLSQSRQACADFVGAADPDEIIFGQNMTSLTFAFSRALAKTWNQGDEIVVTKLDHDANISPWVRAAEDAGVVVRRLSFKPDDCTLDLDELQELLCEKTRLVAVGCASNATGGINPVKTIAKMAHRFGTHVFLDAVHFGPHGLIDVADWDCDFLACSAYKFFGPHLGILWGRRQLLESLDAYRVRPAGNESPGKWMTGTQSHESIVGTMACIDYLADIGNRLVGTTDLPRRKALEKAFQGIQAYEQDLSRRMLVGLGQIPGIKIYGTTDTECLHERFPTISITHEHVSTTVLAQRLADDGINVWHGNYYALEFTESMGLEPEGMVRIGLVHYNTPEEIERLIESVTKATVVSSSNS